MEGVAEVEAVEKGVMGESWVVDLGMRGIFEVAGVLGVDATEVVAVDDGLEACVMISICDGRALAMRGRDWCRSDLRMGRTAFLDLGTSAATAVAVTCTAACFSLGDTPFGETEVGWSAPAVSRRAASGVESACPLKDVGRFVGPSCITDLVPPTTLGAVSPRSMFDLDITLSFLTRVPVNGAKAALCFGSEEVYGACAEGLRSSLVFTGTLMETVRRITPQVETRLLLPSAVFTSDSADINSSRRVFVSVEEGGRRADFAGGWVRRESDAGRTVVELDPGFKGAEIDMVCAQNVLQVQ